MLVVFFIGTVFGVLLGEVHRLYTEASGSKWN